MRNKFSHTLTLFFLCTYDEQWPTFFSDLFTLIQPSEQNAQKGFNRHVSLLFFHIVLEISGEVADQIIKSARSFSAARHTRDGKVRDGVRDRDASRINEAVLTIVSEGAKRMEELRKNPSAAAEPRELDHAIEVVDWGVRTFGSYVGEYISSALCNAPAERKHRVDRYQSYGHANHGATTIYSAC